MKVFLNCCNDPDVWLSNLTSRSLTSYLPTICSIRKSRTCWLLCFQAQVQCYHLAWQPHLEFSVQLWIGNTGNEEHCHSTKTWDVMSLLWTLFLSKSDFCSSYCTLWSSNCGLLSNLVVIMFVHCTLHENWVRQNHCCCTCTYIWLHHI